MRPLLPLTAVALLAASACTVEPVPEPPVNPAAERLEAAGYEPTESDISPDEELLCLPDGERVGCEEPGELRWSVPLEGEYYLDERLDLHRSGAELPEHMYQEDAWPHGLITDDGILHAETHWLRMLDPDTGETLWQADLLADEGLEFVRDGLRSLHATEDHLVLNYVSGVVRLDPDGEVVDHFEQDSCWGRVLGATDEEVALERCGDSNYTRVFDPATGEGAPVTGDLPEEIDGTLVAGSGGAPVLSDGPLGQVDNGYHQGPEGLGSTVIDGAEDLTVARACAPDGLGEASPQEPARGAPCVEPRLYAVNF